MPWSFLISGFRLYVTDNVMIHTFSESGIQIDSYPPSYSDAERVYGLDIDTFTPSDSIFEPSLIYSTFDTFTTRFYERAFEWSNGLELFSGKHLTLWWKKNFYLLLE